MTLSAFCQYFIESKKEKYHATARPIHQSHSLQLSFYKENIKNKSEAKITWNHYF